MKRFMLCVAAIVAAAPALAQTELRGSVGLSDAAFVTDAPRVALFRLGVEWKGF